MHRKVMQGRSALQIRRRVARRLGVPEEEVRLEVMRRGRSMVDGSPIVKALVEVAGRGEVRGDGDEAKNLLEGLLARMGIEAAVSGESEGLVLEIEPNDSSARLLEGDAIGLEAVQQILSRMLSARGCDAEVHVDVGDYRKRRRDDLKRRVREWVDVVRREGGAMETEPFVAGERKVIHRLASDLGGVRTYSVGGGMKKRVVIEAL